MCRCEVSECRLPQNPVKVECKADSDCNVVFDESGRRQPVSSKKVPRKHAKFKPCQDGETDSVCQKGACVLKSWKC